MREMQTGGIKRSRTKGGNGREERTDEIIRQDEGMYSACSPNEANDHTTYTDRFVLEY